MFGGLNVAKPREDADDTLAFVTRLALDGSYAEHVAHNLAVFPAIVRSRGVFFLGISRLLEARKGKQTVDEMLAHANVGNRVVAFKAYPHRDFYKLYYLAARVLAPQLRFDDALNYVARTFFPIFRESILGKTISALMGDGPADVLPLLTKAYNMSVEANEHVLELTGRREAVWRARVEPVKWYPQTFQGIVQGALPDEQQLQVLIDAQQRNGELMDYVFRIRW